MTLIRHPSRSYGHIQVRTSDCPSSSNVSSGVTRANLVIAKVGSGGNVTVYNANGTTHLVGDIVGWLPVTTLPG